jgi:hypothetical protein
MTIETITGYDLLNDDPYGYPNIGYALYRYDNLVDHSITSSVASYASENWGAKTKGSDSYELNYGNQQSSISLKSKEGSILTFTEQYAGDSHSKQGGTSKTSWDFLSSDGLVNLHTNELDKHLWILGSSDTLEGYDRSDIITYTNLSGPGKTDDINITFNVKEKSSSSTDKNSNKLSTNSGILIFSYIGNGYNVNVSTKTNVTATDNVTGIGSLSYTSNITTNITKYNFLNTDAGFNIILTGVTSVTSLDQYDGLFNETKFGSGKTSFSKVTLTTTDYKLTGSNVSYNTQLDENGKLGQMLNLGIDKFKLFSNVTAMQDSLMANVVPNLTNGDNNIFITNKEGFQIDAGTGKDVVVGNIGDDTIISGAGSDKLTGGKGSDMFSFSNTDFYTENTNGELIFNKSADTITDFNLKELDKLDFGDLGELSFYAKLADAKLDNAQLFYVKGSGSIYLNTSTTEDGFTPIVIITLTGKPAVNTDLTDWNYPA